jgi:antitoxin component HigA of HigAB toxin-antitoxin module
MEDLKPIRSETDYDRALAEVGDLLDAFSHYDFNPLVDGSIPSRPN